MSLSTLRKKFWGRKDKSPNVDSKDEYGLVKSSPTNFQDSSTHINATGSKKLWRKREELPNVDSNDRYILAQYSTINVQDSSTHINSAGSGNSIAMGVSTRGADPLSLLLQYATPGAEIDSSARYPPPRCHPNTRTRLQNEIHTWAENSHREKAMLWLYGPAGVGKSAVFQTFAETYRKANSEAVVAAFFLSRPNSRNDPESVFVTLAYQLCTQCEEYKLVVGDVLAKDPLLPTRHFDVQFCKLIVEPLSMLQTSRKMLIAIDGLDECKGVAAQCEIVDLITKAVSNPNLPVLWMISSRPELHLRTLISRPDVQQACWREELPVDTDEAREDTSTYIREEFTRIQKAYSGMLNPDWPGEGRLHRIIGASSGLFAFSSTIIRFIDDPNRPRPESHLKKVMDILDPSTGTSVATSRNRNPLQLLDTLYMRILSDNDEEILPTTLKILHYLCLKSNDHGCPLSVQALGNYLSLDRHSFWSALGKLHSVLQIPFPQRPQNAPYEQVGFLHASFQDFLQDQSRSGSFCVLKDETTSYITTRASEIITSDLYWVSESKFQIQPDERYRKAIELLSWPVGSFTKWPAAFWVQNKLLIDEIILRVINDLQKHLCRKETFQLIGEAQKKMQLPPQTLYNNVGKPYYDSTCQDPEALSWLLALPKAPTLDKDTLSLLHMDDVSDSYIGYVANTNEVPQQVAVRVVKVQPESERLILAKVVQIWSQLTHPNVHQFLGFVDSFERDDSKFPAFIGQPITCTLHQYLKSNVNPDRLSLIRGILNGLNYLHQREIYSGELTPSLIFLDEDGAPLLAHVSQIPYKGSPIEADIELMRYRSVELIWGSVNVPTAACDVYSSALIALYMISGHEPYLMIMPTGDDNPRAVNITAMAMYDFGSTAIFATGEHYEITSFPHLQCVWPILRAGWTYPDTSRLTLQEMKDVWDNIPPEIWSNAQAEES